MFRNEKLKSEFSYNLRAMFSVPTLVVWGAAILLTIITGPFGTYEDLALAPRAMFWGLVVTASVLIGYLSRVVAILTVGHDRPVLFDAVAIATMTSFLAPVVKITGQAFEPVFVFKMASLGMVYLYVFSVALCVFMFRRLTPGIETQPLETMVEKEDARPITALAQEPRLMRRLRSDRQGKILRLSARDHHVEIVTSKGVQTLRMRLTDAINEMEPVEGYCSHRSHWITRDAIKRVEHETAQKSWLILINNDRIPISRKYRGGLEDAGIL